MKIAVITGISNEVNRATMLSISSFSTKFLYMLIGPFVAYSFARNSPENSWLGYALLALFALMLIKLLVKNQLRDSSNSNI